MNRPFESDEVHRTLDEMPAFPKQRLLKPSRAFQMLVGLGLALLPAVSNSQQSRPRLTYEDYARAEQFLPWNATKLAFNLDVDPNWIGETDRFWYCRKAAASKEFLIVDPAKNSSEAAFDHAKLAASLSAAAGKTYESNHLPFEKFEFTKDGKEIRFDIEKAHWKCDLESYQCQKSDESATLPGEVLSPDRRWAAFVRNHDLYLRSLTNKQEIHLTHDGKPYDDYGVSPDSGLSAITERIHSPDVTSVHVVWSPDSKKLVTYRLDQTKVKESYLIQSVVPGPIGTGRPVLHSFRNPSPGDKDVAMARYFVFEVQANKQVTLGLAPQPTSYMPRSDFGWVWWDKEGKQIYFLETDRWCKTLKLNVADALTGASRTIVEEQTLTEIDPAPLFFEHPLVRVLGGGAEAIWFSQRDGWGHLYLYDARTGKLIGRITSGNWLVRSIEYVDEPGRWVYFSASGREPGEDPYLRHLYRIKLDGSDLQLLTPENADHSISFSPSGRYFVDVYSRVDTVPLSVLRSPDGKVVRELERGDLAQLFARGWKPPEAFVVKAADGFTDIYGAIFRPSNFDPSKKYPVLDNIYPGPQIIIVPKSLSDPMNYRNLSALDGYGTAPAIAELGFVVVTVDGRGTPLRSKVFQDYSYNKLGDAGGLEDHVAAIKQLAARYPYLDLDRIGIYGHSGGGFATVRAMLAYPDFYKVGVASSGEHDMRGYNAHWGEKFQGPLESSDYNEASNSFLALNADLKGKLLIAWGDMDDNVPPALELQLIHSLILRNADFDTLVLPNRNHMLMDDPYFIRRRWDYLVENLLGAAPPKGYKIRSSSPTYRTVDPPEKEAK